MKEDITGGALRVENSIEKIRQIHLQVQEILQKLQVMYKARHDKYKIEKLFTVGDKV